MVTTGSLLYRIVKFKTEYVAENEANKRRCRSVKASCFVREMGLYLMV